MKFFKLIIFLSLNLIDFTGESSPPVKSCIKKIKSELSTNWQLSKDSSYYITNYSFLCRLDSVYQLCIKNASEKKILKLFGKPTDKTDYKGYFVIRYLTSPPPKPPKFGCSYLHFRFTNGRLSKVYELGYGVTIDDY